MTQTLADTYMGLAIDLAINVLLKGTVIVGVAGLATHFLRCTSAAVRHAVWSLALLALLVLPALEAVLPTWKVEPLYVRVSAQAASLQQGTDLAGGAESDGAGAAPYAGSSAGAGDVRGAVPVEANESTYPDAAASAGGEWIAAYVLFLWLLGAGMLLGRFAVDALRVIALDRRTAGASADDRALAHRLAAGLGIRRSIRLVVSDELSVPVTFGLWFPVVILPSAASTWSSDRKRVVLLHELAHVRRWDYAIHVMIVVVCALYWFNPLVWLAARLGNLEQERACDDRALVGGVRSDVYATHLVEIARSVVEPTPRGVFAMAHLSSLADRVKSILAHGLDRAPISRQQSLRVAVGAMSFAFPLASLDVWGVLQEEKAGGSVEERVQQLQDDNPQVRRYAAWALGELESPSGVDPLIRGLSDRNADVRLVSAWALGEIKEYSGVEPLIRLLDDRDDLVREMAVLALGEIGSSKAIDPITQAVGDHEALREPAYWALDQIGGQRAHEARKRLVERPNEPGWESGEVWTGDLGTRKARSIGRDVAALIDALDDQDVGMRTSAAEYLGRRGDPRAVEALLDRLRDADPRVRAMAIWALDEINPSRRYSSR